VAVLPLSMELWARVSDIRLQFEKPGFDCGFNAGPGVRDGVGVDMARSTTTLIQISPDKG
jgi:hypothetical protein